MPITIRVKYENGVLKPLTSINLEDGKEYKVIVEEDIDELIKKYKGILGRSLIRELLQI
ncbi:MAG: antitoxin family protein [Caldisphaeraceae archaeon]|nr:antitoxin family protein [Caldisphaeraceae archaeon]MEB3797365.1 antitoxin family protein [Caldisphaeraceae archaeon]